LILENDYLRVSIDDKGFMDVFDKSTGETWKHYPDDEPIGIIQLREDFTQQIIKCNLSATENIHVAPKGSSGARLIFEDLVCEEVPIGGSLEVQVSLREASLNIKIEKADLPSDYALEKIYYPYRSFYLEKDEKGYITWPFGNGILIPTNINDLKDELCDSNLLSNPAVKKLTRTAFTTEIPMYYCGMFSMPWFGAAKRRSAYIAIVDTPDDAGAYITVLDPRNKERLAISPVWEQSYGGLRYPRSITYRFISDGDYVSMAKIFRKYAMERGFYKSLKDKIKDNPNAERIIGAPLIKFWIMDRYPWTGAASRARGDRRIPLIEVKTSYRQVQDFIRDMHDNLGIDRAIILLAGWGPLGYDNVHPDIWPPGRWAGEFGDLRAARDLAERYGFLFGLHDNYQDIYFESPSIGAGESIVKSREVRGIGHILTLGGVWEGGQAFIICSRCGLKYAQRNLPRIMEDLKPTCYFVDTTTAAGLYECYDADHPTTRSEDKEYKIRLLEYLNDLGLITGSECGVYWAAEQLHFGEGIMNFNNLRFPGIAVPLFNLVYHDSIVAYWHQGWPLNKGPMKTKFLADLLYGNPTSWNFNSETYKEFRDELKEIFKVASRLHREICFDEMVNHRFLTEDYLVQESEFSSGVKVIVNFGGKEYVSAEGRIEPMGYLIIRSREKNKI